MFQKWFNRQIRKPSPAQILTESQAKREECHRYFREMDELSQTMTHSWVDPQDRSDQELIAQLRHLFGLAPEMARIQAIAVWNLLLLEEAPTTPARTVEVHGRSFQVFNGGSDRFEQLVEELIFALQRAPQDDPEIRQIDRMAAQRYRPRLRRASLSSVPG